MLNPHWPLLLFLFCWPVSALAQAPADSPELTTAGKNGNQQFSAVPREPYQSGFEQYQRSYLPPVDDALPESLSSSIPEGSRRKKNSAKAHKEFYLTPRGKLTKNYQNETRFRLDQEKISSRSRAGVPSSLPNQHRVYGPGQSPARIYGPGQSPAINN